MKKITLLIFIAFITNACDIFESDATIYFDVTGEGYAYNRDTNKPIPFAKIDVSSSFNGNGWATKQPVSEYFIADSLGFYKVKFIKRIDKESPIAYCIGICGYIGSPDIYHMSSTSSFYSFTDDEIMKAHSVIKIDTLTASFIYY